MVFCDFYKMSQTAQLSILDTCSPCLRIKTLAGAFMLLMAFLDIPILLRLNGMRIYCSYLLNGLTQKKKISRLQRIQNRCAELIFERPKLTRAWHLCSITFIGFLFPKRIKFCTPVHYFNT